ncbi:MAG: M13 family metallopeptidase [Bacteroidota bacterium]
MKKPILSLLAVIALFSCHQGKTVKEAVDIKPEVTSVVNVVADEPVRTYTKVPSSVEFEDMNPNADPRVDFYEYANGIWVKNNPVPATENKWSSFNMLLESNNRKLRAILEKSSAQPTLPKGSIEQLIGDYYYTYMDSVKRDKDGITPIKNDLKKIDNLKSKKELATLLAWMHNHNIQPLFSMGIDQDLKDIDLHAVYTGQGGILLPNKDYYSKTDSSSADIRKKYVSHMARMYGFLGYNEKKAMSTAENMLALETKMAEAMMGPVELRDIDAQYNKKTVEELKTICPSFDWNTYITARGYTNVKEIIVSQPKHFAQMELLLKEKTLDEWKDYLRIQYFEAVSSKLSFDIEKENFDFFFTTLRGTKKMKQRWERAINSMSWTALGEALGHAFVNEHFSPESKKKVNEMVDNIFIAFKERLSKLEWMSVETQGKALEKLASFTRKLGYPDKWTDYSTLTITRESYYKNWMESNRFQVQQNTDKLGKPIDRSEWLMAPHIVNAYYNPPWNEIVFPAGIMQPPFFDPNKEDAVNYARMGAVIGHEFLHGFDDQGAQFDATGKFTNWWTEDDSKKFGEKTKRLVDHFNSFEALPGIFVNGELTLGENIADLGGLTMAYYAYQHSLEGKEKKMINGFTNEQRFFIAFAQIWKENHTESSMKLQVFTNPHSPGKFRVLGPLSNMPEFFEAFKVREGDPMRRPVEKMANIW